jgi:hypothetical protein
MANDRIPTHLWIGGHLRRCHAEGVFVTVAHKGDPTGGLVLLKLNMLEHGCRVLTQTRDFDGELAWLPALDGKLVAEADADAYIKRAIKRDPDLWAVEVEDRNGWHPFEGKVLS